MIRPALHDDMPALRALTHACYSQLLAADYPAATLRAALPHMCAVDAGYLTAAHYRVWDDDGAGPVGAVGWSARDDTSAEVRKLATHPDHLRRGIARALMASIEQDAAIQGHKVMHCASSLTAVPFYISCGYTVIGPDQIETGQAGVVFAIVQLSKAI